MKLFLWVNLILTIIGIVLRIVLSTTKPYPRINYIKPVEDIIYVIIAIATIFWIIILL
jgi:hypothetical protein